MERNTKENLKSFEEEVSELRTFIMENFVSDNAMLNKKVYEARRKLAKKLDECPHQEVKNGICTCCKRRVFYED